MTATPDGNWVTFSVDGREVRAPENEWLVDAVKRGDVEVPYFCYEPKLGNPVGACRMCLVEVEGMPKLQTSCSTPVKDGMVVHTQTDRVKHAQNAVVEFLLVNHPLDCPVCDKGGECPLQDISYGWGPGRSRFHEQKRNFPKPIALSPLVAIDRERCILCYRCVRFSQEVAEDYQLVFLERADHTFVGTFDGRPYVAPFSGNIIELCPVGALTSTTYRFRARPWDIENAGSVCTLCPSQCNVAFSVRDERVERVLARDNDEVDDGWLCDKGRWGHSWIAAEDRVTQPLVRDGGMLRPVSWEGALDAAAEGLRRTGAASAAIVGGDATNEEGYVLQRIFREALGSPHVESRTEALEPGTARLLSHPSLAASVRDVERASVVVVLETDPINEAPILDLRLRKAVGRAGTRLIVAGTGVTALDAAAGEVLRFAPGAGEALLRGLQKALVEVDLDEAPEPAVPQASSHEGGAEGQPVDAASERPRNGALAGQSELASFLMGHPIERLAEYAEVEVQDLRDAARMLTGAENVVIIWGERLGHGEGGAGALRALGDFALLLGLDASGASGLLEVPARTNARGLREVGCLPNLGPGLADTAPGMTALQARDAAERSEIRGFYLLRSDPFRDQRGAAAWESALRAASFVVAHAEFLSHAVATHADVVFPAEAYAEKEGTVTHPDGRLQRLRPAIGRPGEVRMEWQVLTDLGTRLGLDLGRYVSAGAIFTQISEQVPMYRGITLDEIGGKGVRWQEREASLAAISETLGDLHFSSAEGPPATPAMTDGSLRLAARPDLWTGWVTERSPQLRFLRPVQELELHPLDAERLGVRESDEVDVAGDGGRVRARVRVRGGAKRGTAMLIQGTGENDVDALRSLEPRLVRVEGLSEDRASSATPAAAAAGQAT